MLKSILFLIIGLLIPILIVTILNIDYLRTPTQLFTEVTVKNHVIDLGLVDTTKNLVGVFELQNTGKNDLVINDVQVSCLCTVVDWPKGRIAPNESVKIEVEYNPKSSGFFNQKIQVFCNIENSLIILILKGKVEL
ncbi:MAG: DUF1573 domain-containing protein [Fulvivirga sp.]|uniref:DUF1573 domain-containing protein n=1 Tax=Fulvivirga sp. TaxID=1931237 RepID=UPI0032EDB3A3